MADFTTGQADIGAASLADPDDEPLALADFTTGQPLMGDVSPDDFASLAGTLPEEALTAATEARSAASADVAVEWS